MLKTKSELVEVVGNERWARGCRLARTEAARPDFGGNTIPAVLDLPHELEPYIWQESDASWTERIALLFAIYDDMPAYGHLMYAKDYYADFSPDDRRQWWSAVCARLSGPSTELRQPLQYTLWCDFFEDPTTVEEAWRAVAGPAATQALLRHVLPVAGPVPYRLKEALYHRLAKDPGWHEAIFQSLLGSAFDVYGDVDRRDVQRLLAKLELPAGLPRLEELRQALQRS